MFLEGGENLNFAIPVNDAKNLLSTNLPRSSNLPNEQPSENATSAEGNENSNDLREQIEQLGGCKRKLATGTKTVTS